MANSQLFAGTDKVSIVATTVRYYMVGNVAVITSNSTEANAQAKHATSGTYSLMGCYVSSNDRGDATLRFRLNGGNGNQIITLGNGVTGQHEDGSNSDAVVDNDLVNYSLTPGGGGTSFIVTGFWQTFAPSSNTETTIGADMAGSFSGTADLFFCLNHCSNSQGASTTEANNQNTIAAASTLRYGQARISANTRSETTNIRTRINGVSGNIDLVFTSGATGLQEDVTNTDTIADGDEVGWIWDQGGGTGNQTIRNHKIVVTSSSNTYPMLGMNAAGNSFANNVTHYVPVGGDVRMGSTSEADAQLKSNETFTWSDLYAYVSDYSLSGGSPNLALRSRVNGGNGNMSIPTIGTTGQVSDTSNTDSIADNDELCWQVVTTGNAGSARIRTFTSLATGSGGGGGKVTKNTRAYALGQELGMNLWG